MHFDEDVGPVCRIRVRPVQEMEVILVAGYSLRDLEWSAPRSGVCRRRILVAHSMPRKKHRRMIRRGGIIRIADLDRERLTPQRPSSIQFPVLFGCSATAALMCIAANPHATLPEIMTAMGRRSRGPVVLILGRLLRRGLILRCGRRYAKGRPVEYIINPGLKAYREFRAFLRRYADAFGMLLMPARTRMGANAKTSPMPRDLCWTPTRTDIVLLAALCGEVYPGEVLGFIRGPLCRITVRFDDLAQEGVLRYRIVSGALLHSLNPDYPGAIFLRKLLRAVAKERPDIQAEAKFLLSRRRADARDDTLHGKRRHIAQALISRQAPSHLTRPRRARRGSGAIGRP